MTNPTNEELAERLEAVEGYLAKIAEAFLLGQAATPLHVFGPANGGEAAQVFAEAAEAANIAAARLRQPLAFRWGRESQTRRSVYLGDVRMGGIGFNGARWSYGMAGGPWLGHAATIAEAKAALEAHITAQVTGGAS